MIKTVLLRMLSLLEESKVWEYTCLTMNQSDYLITWIKAK